MNEEGAGGRTMAYCHQCQGLASMAGDSFIHLDGTPLCKEEISHDACNEVKWRGKDVK